MSEALLTKTGRPRMAKHSYKSATCSALRSVFLFKNGDLIRSSSCVPGEPLSLCLGDRDWVVCPNGLPDVFTQLQENDYCKRLADYSDDWGVIANAAGEILYRASTYTVVRKVHYLGREDGPLETTPLTIEKAGLRPVFRK